MADVENPVDSTITKNEETKAVEETPIVNGDHKPEQTEGAVDPVDKENGEVPKEESEEKTSEEPKVEGETTNTPTENVESKEQPTPKVVLHQFPPSKNVPNLSMFCLKVETFLRLHKVPYENQYGWKAGRKGKLPWIEYKDDKVVDSHSIVDYLNEKFELNKDNELTADQHALGHVITTTLEENTYFAHLYHRYIIDFGEAKKLMSQTSGGGLAFNLNAKMIQRKIRSYLHGQGMGRHAPEEVYEIAQKDLKAVSVLLGEKDFLLGNEPSSYDCTVFGLLAILLWSGVDEKFSTFMKENTPNLVTYCERVKALCWTDWDDMVLGDKPTPNLKKGFSFRKKKAKVQKTKEEPQEPAAEAEDDKKDTENEEVKKEEETKEETTEEPAQPETADENKEKEKPTESTEPVAEPQTEEVKKIEEQQTKVEEAITNEE